MNQIIFLGTGGGRHVTAKQDRYTGGIILKIENYQIHLDPGPGALVRCKEFGINPEETSTFLLSHKHIDHSNDINILIDALTEGGRYKKGTLITSESMSPEESILDKNRISWLNRFIQLKPQEVTKIGNIAIKALPTKHSDEKGIGFKITTNDFVLTYTSDTDYSTKIINSYLDSDILILNCGLPELQPSSNHLCTGKTKKILNKVKPKLAIITHFGKEMLKSNPLYEAREIQRETGIQTIAAHDGMIIDPISYSASSKQKRLNSFN